MKNPENELFQVAFTCWADGYPHLQLIQLQMCARIGRVRSAVSKQTQFILVKAEKLNRKNYKL